METGEILLKKGLLDRRQLDLARSSQAEGLRVDQAAVQLGFLTEEAALRALGEEVGLDFIDLGEAEVDLSLLQKFPQKFIHREALFPMRQTNGTLIVATSDPFNLYPLDELSVATGLTVVPVLAAKAEIDRLIKTTWAWAARRSKACWRRATTASSCSRRSRPTAPNSRRWPRSRRSSGWSTRSCWKRSRCGPATCTSSRYAAGLQVRYRIDGVLHPQPIPPEINRFQAAIISRLKIMARLNIAEQRLPQDGRIKLKVAGREVDVRVSVIPMIHGEGIVLRLLDKGGMEFTLRKLGMEDDLYTTFRELIDLPHGIILVTGPTGSGKIDHALQFALGNPQRRNQDHHHRRPGRIPAGRHQPDSGAREDRADVRHVACGAFCVTTRTSCWWAKSATWKRPKTPSRRR